MIIDDIPQQFAKGMPYGTVATIGAHFGNLKVDCGQAINIPAKCRCVATLEEPIKSQEETLSLRQTVAEPFEKWC